EDGIKELAKICLSCVREVDIAGRWSSEQIIILCPQTPISASKILADRLKEAVETHQREDIRDLPFSIGLAALQEGETFADWYERASQALYLARRQHGGKVMIAET
nr:diguanylate cyclase [Planctomycetota bacterium]